MADLDLCYVSVREALMRYRYKSFSPVELMQAVLARADAVEPQINAFAFRFDDTAMIQASPRGVPEFEEQAVFLYKITEDIGEMYLERRIREETLGDIGLDDLKELARENSDD